MSLFTEKEFARLWAIGGFLGAMRWLEILVIGIYAFQVSGSPFVVAIMLVSRMLPMALFGTFIGALVENMDRRQVLIWTCVLMTLSALTGAIAAAINIMRLFLILIPLVYLGSNLWNTPGFFFGISAANFVTGMIAWLWYRSSIIDFISDQ